MDAPACTVYVQSVRTQCTYIVLAPTGITLIEPAFQPSRRKNAHGRSIGQRLPNSKRAADGALSPIGQFIYVEHSHTHAVVNGEHTALIR